MSGPREHSVRLTPQRPSGAPITPEEVLFGCQTSEIINDIANTVLQYTSEGMDDLEKALTAEIGMQHRNQIAKGVDRYYETLTNSLQSILEAFEESATREVFNMPRNVAIDDLKNRVENVLPTDSNLLNSKDGASTLPFTAGQAAMPSLISFKKSSDMKATSTNSMDIQKVVSASSEPPRLGATSSDLDIEIEALRSQIQDALVEASEKSRQTRRINRALVRLRASLDGSVFQNSALVDDHAHESSILAAPKASTDSLHSNRDISKETEGLVQAAQQIFASVDHADPLPIIASEAAKFAQVARMLEKLATGHPLLRRLPPQASKAVHSALQRSAIAAQQQAGLGTGANNAGLTALPLEAISAASEAAASGAPVSDDGEAGSGGEVNRAVSELGVNATTEELDALLRSLTMVPQTTSSTVNTNLHSGRPTGVTATPSIHTHQGVVTPSGGVDLSMLLPGRRANKQAAASKAAQAQTQQFPHSAVIGAAAQSQNQPNMESQPPSHSAQQVTTRQIGLLERLQLTTSNNNSRPTHAGASSLSTTNSMGTSTNPVSSMTGPTSLVTPFRSNRVPRRDFDK